MTLHLLRLPIIRSESCESPRSHPIHPLDLSVPPLVVLAAVGGLMWLGGRVVPVAHIFIPARPAIAVGLAVLGVGTAMAGVVSFRIARTTVNPLKPETASRLVVAGIYRLTRNPMYLGAFVTLLGWAAVLATVTSFIVSVAFVFYLNRFQIAPEEKALTARFGSEFAAYCVKVRRWI